MYYEQVSHGKEQKSTIKVKEIIRESLLKIHSGVFQKETRNDLRNDAETTCKFRIKISIIINKRVEIKYKEINELKNRCLLFISDTGEEANESSLKDVNLFIEIVTILNSIHSMLTDLNINGYPEEFEKTFHINEGNITEIKEFQASLLNRQKEWTADIDYAYKKYYILTLFYGNQFWCIERTLSYIHKSNYRFEQEGYNFIKRINIPENKLSQLLNIDVSEKLNPKERLDRIGTTLSQVIDNNSDIYNYNNKKKVPFLKIPIKLKENIINFYKNTNATGDDNYLMYSNIDSNSNMYQYILSIYLCYQRLIPYGSQILFCQEDMNYHYLYSFLLRATLLNDNNILFTIVKPEKLSLKLQMFLLKFICENSNNFKLPNDTSKEKNQEESKEKNQEEINTSSPHHKKWSIVFLCEESNSYISCQLQEMKNIYKIQSLEILEGSTIISLLKEYQLINSILFTSKKAGNGKSFTIRNYQKEKNFAYYQISLQDDLNIDLITNQLYKVNQEKNKNIKVHFNIRGHIQKYEFLDYLLFSYIFLNEILYINSTKFCSNHPDSLILIEISTEFDYKRLNVLNLIPEKIECEFNITNFVLYEGLPENKILQYKYLINYLNFYALDLITCSDVNSSHKEWEEKIDIGIARSLLFKHIIQYQKEETLTYRNLWTYISFVGSQLIDMTNNQRLSMNEVKKYKFEDVRGLLYETLLISCEEFTMNKDIISWDSMKRKYILLFNNSMPVMSIYDDYEELPEELQKYNEHYFPKQLNKDYTLKSHDELVEMLKLYCGKIDYTEFLKNNGGSSSNKILDLANLNLNIIKQNIKKQPVFKDLINNLKKGDAESGIKENDMDHYVLTPDNFLKMILIIQRANANIPIILIGETGCGKTSLIRFVAEKILGEKIYLINIHNGMKYDDISLKIKEIVVENSTDLTNRIWIFLDEMNTCNYLGLLTEIICEHKMDDNPLPPNFYFVGASNPYRVNEQNNIINVGLKFRDEDTSKANPEKLTYKVNKFTLSLSDYIWDYGQINSEREQLYISKILSDLHSIKENDYTIILENLIFETHKFFKEKEPCYIISLRDIARFKTLYRNMKLFFEEYKSLFGIITNDKVENKKIITYSIISSIFICYYIKLSSKTLRLEYITLISKIMNLDHSFEYTIDFIMRTIVRNFYINKIYALNEALLENIFCLFICVINKLPIFICGKPGSSKTLSTQIMISNIIGEESKNNFLSKFPKVTPIYYQGSERSTSEGIQKVFDKANDLIADNKNKPNIVPMIVFDEIGLAEISPNNPLKILHSLLDYNINNKISFVGISNWTLDASKMSRVVYLSRPDPDIDDLIFTGATIYKTMVNHNDEKEEEINSSPEDLTQSSIVIKSESDNNELIRILSTTYYFFKQNFKETKYEDFYGIRDYYSLIKQMISFNTRMSILMGIPEKIKICLYRNFCGLDNEIKHFVEIYNDTLKKFIHNTERISEFSIDDSPILTLSLINYNLNDNLGRYLLLFTPKNINGVYIISHYIVNNNFTNYEIIMGSKFKSDIEKEDYIFKILSQIKIAMAKGKCIILKDLDYIYGALYDLFNQNFTIQGDKKYCRIALGGTNNPTCYVHDKFKCIVISNDNNLPPPFLNRFEKQTLVYENILSTQQLKIYQDVLKWLSDGILLNEDKCKLCFVGFNKEDFLYNIIIKNCEKEDYFYWIKFNIIQMANMNFSLAISSNEKNKDINEVIEIYYDKQCHSSFNELHNYNLKLEENLEKNKSDDDPNYLYELGEKDPVNKYIIYTYSNILDKVYSERKGEILAISLSDILSEKKITEAIENVINHGDNCNTLIVKVDYNKYHDNLDYFKFKVEALLHDNKLKNKKLKFIYLIIYLTFSTANSTSDSSNESNSLKVELLSDWNNIFIDNINGNIRDKQISKGLLNNTSSDIIKKFFNESILINFISKIVFNLNYRMEINEEKYNLSNHLMKIISTFNKRNSEFGRIIFELIIMQIKKKRLDDWKIFIIEQSKRYALNSLYKIIIEYIYDVVSPILKSLLYLIEVNNSFFTFNSNSKLFKQIITDQVSNQMFFMKLGRENNSEIIQFDEFKFPFSQFNFATITSIIKEEVDKILIADNTIKISKNNYTDDLKELYDAAFSKVNEIISKTCFIFKYNTYMNDLLMSNYIYDLHAYYIKFILKLDIYNPELMNTIINFLQSVSDIIFKKISNNNINYLFIFLMKNDVQFKELINIFLLLDKYLLIKIITKIITEFNKSNSMDSNNLYNNDLNRVDIENNLFNTSLSVITQEIIRNFDNIQKDIINQILNINSTNNKDINEHYSYIKLISLYKESGIDKDFKVEVYNDDENSLYLHIIETIKTNFNLNIQASFRIFELMLSMNNISNEIKERIISVIFYNNLLMSYSSKLIYKYLSGNNIISTHNLNDFKDVEGNENLINLFKNIKVMNKDCGYNFLTDHFGLYLNKPKETKEKFNYLISEYDYYTHCLDSINYEKNDMINFSLYCAYIKHYILIYSEIISGLLEGTMEVDEFSEGYGILKKIETIMVTHDNKEILINCKILIIKNIINILKINPSNLINYNLNKAPITWLNKAELESETNALMLLPKLTKVNDQYNAIEQELNSLIFNKTDESVKGIINLIESSASIPIKKFCIFQYIVLNAYLSYTNKSKGTSNTLKEITEFFINSEEIKLEIAKTFNEESVSFISDLINNFEQNNNVHKCFKLTPTSKDIGYVIFIIYLKCFYLSNTDNPKCILTKFFKNLSDSYTNFYIPGNCNNKFDDQREGLIEFAEQNFQILGRKVGLYECQCGYIYQIQNCTRPMGVGICPFCGIKIGAKAKHVLVDTSRCLINVENRKNVIKEELIKDMKSRLIREKGYMIQYDIGALRNISQFNMYFYSVIFHSLFLFGGSLNEEFQKIFTKKNESKVPENEEAQKSNYEKYINLHTFTSYNFLIDNSNCKDVYIIMLLLLERLAIDSYGSLDVDFSVYDQRCLFEREFENISSEIMKNKSVLISTYIKENCIKSDNLLLSIVNSTASKEEVIKYNSNLYPIFTYFQPIPQGNKWSDICNTLLNGNASEELSLKESILGSSKNSTYKYILIINQYLDQIKLLDNLTPISTLSNYLINQLNYKIKRDEGKEKKIKDYLDVDNNKAHQILWNDFSQSWNNIAYKATQFKCKILPKLNDLSLDHYVSFLLCDDKELGYGMYIAAAYQFFGLTQNEILDKYYEDSEKAKNAKKYRIQLLSKNEIIHFDSDLIDVYEKFYYKYDFNNRKFEFLFKDCDIDIKNNINIECKKYMEFEDLNVIQYSNEILSFNLNQHSNFIDVISEAIPQVPIQNEAIITSIYNDLSTKNSNELNNIFNNIELLCCQLKYEKNTNPNFTIFNYLANKPSTRKDLFDKILDWPIIKSIKVSNIIQFYEIIEEKMYDFVINWISPEYKIEFTPEELEGIKGKFMDMFNNNTNGDVYPKLIFVIKALKRFIIRCLRTDIDNKKQLVFYLTRNDFWSKFDNIEENTMDNFSNDFPQDILIKHTVATFNLLKGIYDSLHNVNYSDKKEGIMVDDD